MDPTFCAYLAGFFDGEGNVGVQRASRSGAPRARLQIAQKDCSILHEIQGVFGGRVSSDKRGQSMLTIYQRDEVERTIDAMLPYSRLKRPQLVVALALVRLQGRGKGRSSRSGLSIEERAARERLVEALSAARAA